MLPITWNIERFQAQKIITLPIISKINFRSISSLQRVACPVSPPDNLMTQSTTSVGWTQALPSCWFFYKMDSSYLKITIAMLNRLTINDYWCVFKKVNMGNGEAYFLFSKRLPAKKIGIHLSNNFNPWSTKKIIFPVVLCDGTKSSKIRN